VCLLGHDRTHVCLECVHASRACALNLHVSVPVDTVHLGFEGFAFDACMPYGRVAMSGGSWRMCCERQTDTGHDHRAVGPTACAMTLVSARARPWGVWQLCLVSMAIFL
jgi:hypothetical protein